MAPTKMLTAAAAALALAAAIPGAHAQTRGDAKVYAFRVACTNDSYVALWNAGEPDPGKDYFRLATGDLNLDCTIADHNPRWDAGLPERWCAHPGPIARGFPPLLIIMGATHCRE